jgi:DNA-binding CsgD family transcriptional regulator/PAS domain-containing protein
MQEAERIPSLIGDIYDAALDPVVWPRALEKMAQFVGGRAAGLFTRDAARKTGNVHYEVGTDPRYGKLYFDKYANFDPMSGAYLALGVGEAYIYNSFMPRSEFNETRFYQEWVKPQGWVDNVSVTLEKTGTSLASLSILHHESDGHADDAARRRLQVIAPHVRRAVMISSAMESKTAEAAAFADTLDGVSAGMFLVDANGQIVHANASGQAMLDERSVLRAGSGRLAAIAPGADQELNQTLALAGGGDAALGLKGIALLLTARDGEHYVAHALPLTSGKRRRAGAGYAATAALFVRKATLEAPSPPETIARHYKLTPTELRVLLAVVEVGGVPEVAEALGIGGGTVKTHLHRLFAKTDTARQADLVKLVAGFSNPLVN